MSILDVNSVFDLGKSIIERIWPDAGKRAEEMRKLEELRQNGDLEKLKAHVTLMGGQIETNQIEAKSGSLFLAGWRPAVGWIGAISLGMVYIPKSVVMTIIWTYQCIAVIKGAENIGTVILPIFPDLGVTDLLALLGSMLGFGAMRSWDKSKGHQTDKLSAK